MFTVLQFWVTLHSDTFSIDATFLKFYVVFSLIFFLSLSLSIYIYWQLFWISVVVFLQFVFIPHSYILSSPSSACVCEEKPSCSFLLYTIQRCCTTHPACRCQLYKDSVARFCVFNREIVPPLWEHDSEQETFWRFFFTSTVGFQLCNNSASVKGDQRH